MFSFYYETIKVIQSVVNITFLLRLLEAFANKYFAFSILLMENVWGSKPKIGNIY